MKHVKPEPKSTFESFCCGKDVKKVGKHWKCQQCGEKHLGVVPKGYAQDNTSSIGFWEAEDKKNLRIVSKDEINFLWKKIFFAFLSISILLTVIIFSLL